ncbi:MAG: hypothetical protein ACHQF4_05780 [Sphingobacteriales bacterium]
MKICNLCLIVIVGLFTACTCSDRVNDKKALNDLIERYPQMYSKQSIEGYFLTRMIYRVEDSIELSLYVTKENNQKIVIFSRSNGLAYAVPFPDNNNRSYWRFYSDNINPSINKTFNGELHKAIRVVSINNKRLATSLITDMLTSLIGSREILDNDTDRIKALANNNNSNDSCNVLQSKNYQSILKLMRFDKNKWWNFNAFWDDQFGRTYQIITKDSKQRDDFYFDARVYQWLCIIKPLIM